MSAGEGGGPPASLVEIALLETRPKPANPKKMQQSHNEGAKYSGRAKDEFTLERIDALPCSED